MKRLISVLLCMVLLLCVTTSLAATSTEKKPLNSYFEKLDGYKYDKFTKEWSYYQAWSHEYRDAYVVIGIEVDGNSESQMPPSLYCWIRDANNREVIHVVKKILFLVGDELYTFNYVVDGEGSSAVLLGEGAKEFLEALAKADSVNVRLSYNIASIDEEIPSKEYKTSLKAAAKAILDSNIWDYVDSEWSTITFMFDPTKE